MVTGESPEVSEDIQAQGPDDERPPKVTTPPTKAGGWSAIQSTMKELARETGFAKGASSLLKINQRGGFDCPGCAWPDPDDRRSLTEFCENGVKAMAEEATRKTIGPEFFKEYSVSELSTWTDHELGKAGRLIHPLICREGATHYEALPWEEVFGMISQALKNLPNPNEAIFYTSGRTSNEAAFLYQLMVRLYGTNNLPDCSNMCHESSGVALKESIGIAKGTVTLEDVETSDLILVAGQNPGTNHPRMLAALQKAVRRGGKVISVNPLPEAGLAHFQHPQEPWTWAGKGTPLATTFLQVKINGDVALFKGIAKALLEISGGNALDPSFVDRQTHGFEAYRAALQDLSWEDLEVSSGIGKNSMIEVAEKIISAKSMICCWAMGLTQHPNAVANIQELVHLLLLGGHFGKPGSGVCPVRGHSNVQGDRTMGIYEKPDPAFLEKIEEHLGVTLPREHGVDVVDAIRSMDAGEGKVFIAMGGNFLSATPDTEKTAQALNSCQLTVQVSTKLNRSHLIKGKTALILPCYGRTDRDLKNGVEQFVTVENSMGYVHASKGHLDPISDQLKSEVDIVASLAQCLLEDQNVIPWDRWKQDYGLIREAIAGSVAGFEGFHEKVLREDGFYLPNPIRDERRFLTADGKAPFVVHPLPKLELKEGQFLMMTIRTHDQYNTTIYGLNDRYRGIHQGRRVVLMNPEDMKDGGIEVSQMLDLRSHFKGEERLAKNFRAVPYSIPKGCAATYFPETNVLVPLDSVAEKSNTPTSKYVIISLHPAE